MAGLRPPAVSGARRGPSPRLALSALRRRRRRLLSCSARRALKMRELGVGTSPGQGGARCAGRTPGEARLLLWGEGEESVTSPLNTHRFRCCQGEEFASCCQGFKRPFCCWEVVAALPPLPYLTFPLSVSQLGWTRKWLTQNFSSPPTFFLQSTWKWSRRGMFSSLPPPFSL